MATYRNGLTGEISLYIMEPAEELEALRFIALHKPDLVLSEWLRLKPDHKLTTQEQADELNLNGGYGLMAGGNRQ